MKTRNFTQKKQYFSNNSFCHKNNSYNKMIRNDCKDFVKNFTIYHNFDLICFQKCSNWILKLSKITNNKISHSNELLGRINEKNIVYDKKYNIQNDLSKYFPIDMRNNQRFSLDKNIPKIPLLITFNFEDLNNKEKNEFFTQLNSDYSNLLFEIDLNANLHENKNIFKDNINFKVKGYDILKSIQNKISSLKINKIIEINNEELFFENYVFNNIQCSFGIGFSISKNNLINYFKLKNYTFLENKIKITKLFLNYSLPLIVFSRAKKIPNQLYNNNMNKIINYNNINNYISNNFCNFHSLMTYTTPFIYETEELKIKNILESFIKPSLFGINCLFKLDNLKYTNIKYFPTLNSLYINTINNSSSNSNNNSTLDGSFLSKSSEDKENKNNRIQNNIFFKEPIKEIYNMPNYIEQYNKIQTNFPEIKELELGEINNDSYFSLIWTPIKTFQNKNFDCIEFDNMNNISFEIFYKFKSGVLDGHYLTVSGIQGKNIKGVNIDGENIFQLFDYFMFSNNSIIPIPYMKNYSFHLFQLQQILTVNKHLFCALKNNINNNSFFGISD